MITYKSMHFMIMCTKGRKGWVALKINFSKAHDKICWEYLKEIMIKLGFASE